MSEIIGPQRDFPSSANRILVWIGIPTALLLAVLAFFGALGRASDMAYATCQKVGWCQIAQAPKEAPKLPNFTSTRVDGGHSYREFCEPVAETYREQHPEFNVTWHEAGDGRDKDWKGHATYRYLARSRGAKRPRKLGYPDCPQAARKRKAKNFLRNAFIVLRSACAPQPARRRSGQVWTPFVRERRRFARATSNSRRASSASTASRMKTAIRFGPTNASMR